MGNDDHPAGAGGDHLRKVSGMNSANAERGNAGAHLGFHCFDLGQPDGGTALFGRSRKKGPEPNVIRPFGETTAGLVERMSGPTQEAVIPQRVARFREISVILTQVKPLCSGFESQLKVVVDNERRLEVVAKLFQLPGQPDQITCGIVLGTELQNIDPSFQQLPRNGKGDPGIEIAEITDAVEPGSFEADFHPRLFSSRNFATQPMSYFPAMKSG